MKPSVIPAAALLAISLVLLGAAGASWWDSRPAGEPSISFWFVRWTAPDSLLAQRDKARSDLALSLANERQLSSALDAQNAALADISAKGEIARERAETAVARYRSELATASAAKLPTTGPECFSDDEAFIAYLKEIQP